MAFPWKKPLDFEPGSEHYLARMRRLLGSDTTELPFTSHDATAGAENELQAVVVGRREDCDLPQVIEQSNYHRNLVRRMRAGEMPRTIVDELQRYLSENKSQIWENSWVRFPRRRLCRYAEQVFQQDLRTNKQDPRAGERTDRERFILHAGGEELLRLPASYLLKLALAEALGATPDTHPLIKATGEMVMTRFLNDNTSPEIASFQPVRLHGAGLPGSQLARETAKRLLLVQALIAFANQRLGLAASGQRVLVYSAPHPPVRQKRLNAIISDAFYRELFMNPCLSGWEHGEEKSAYMHLCHEVLSRSQLNAVLKLKEAGIVTSNLVNLPSISNISLANNGTHISLGSLKLSALLGDLKSDFLPEDEKYLGDLTIKIVEHFLPLFVGTYSAAPYRLGFSDFHPEQALGFLPHELDFTHLRMLWRRWRKKADLHILGRAVTPFGPRRLDDILSRVFTLRGDYVPDFRLIDYLVSLLSTDESPALDGQPGSSERLKGDLEAMGVFDRRMSLYLFYKLREHARMGFSGFEGRHYSLFPSLIDDMGPACGLQALITALAYRYALTGRATHAHIPDDPTLESERRQVLFGAAIGLPTFFVRKDSRNAFLMRIIAKTAHTRSSHRYPGYIRVCHREFRLALLDVIREDAPDLVEQMGMRATLDDLELRLTHPEMHGAAAAVTTGILQDCHRLNPLDIAADDFNLAAEHYYRTTLRRRHIQEGREILKAELWEAERDPRVQPLFKAVCGPRDVQTLIARMDGGLDELGEEDLRRLIHLILLTVLRDSEKGHAAPVR